LFFVLTVLLL